jgi:hypothetical protein
MSNLAEIVTLYDTNCHAIPAMLRKLADSIEAEEPTEHDLTRTVVLVQAKASGELEIYGWGDADNVRTVGLFHCAASKLA